MTPTPIAAKVPPVVFVIDDDASVRAALSSLVRSVGLQVEVFASASEFLAARLDDLSCLILDVRDPGMSGLHFQAEICKGQQRHSHYLHHRSRRYPNVGQGDEGWRCRVGNEAISRPGPLGCH